jgi:tetratricopeptide (TPR) repeat protein
MIARCGRVPWCAVVVFALAPVEPAQGQVADTPFNVYRTIVADYGRRDATAITRLERQRPEDLDAAVRRATRADDVWPWETQRLAALLHTEVWLRCRLAACAAAPDAHLDHAARLLDAVSRVAPRQRDFVERWRISVAGLLSHFDGPRAADALTTIIRERTATDERVTRAYHRGLAVEWDGSLKGQIRAFTPIGAGSSTNEFQSRYWLAAAEAFKDALRRDPNYRPAALHLGRIRLLQGDVREASRLFEHARRSDDLRVVYLAALFAGSLAELDGNFDDADALYRQALMAYPTGQSAVMAWSQLLGRLGRDRDAEDALLRVLATDARVVDPLWTYLPPPRTELSYLLADIELLVAEVVR